ncbi:MAG: hypothetical protein AAFY28_09250, partial [Actinomycetota bacterium]
WVTIGSLLWFATAVLLGVVATLVVASAWSADAAPGDDDSTYVPWPGCRLTDTRADSQIGPRGTKLGADEVMTVEVHGEQGECVGPLAIPSDAVGLATNVTVVDATAQSNIRVYRGDLTEPPLLSNLNVTPGASPTPNKVDTQLAPDGTLKVYNFKGSVNIVIDVVGYYTPQSLVDLAAQAGTPGPQGPAGPSGITPPPGVFTRLQIVEGAILECDEVQNDGQRCQNPIVNGRVVGPSDATYELICEATVGPTSMIVPSTFGITIASDAYEFDDGAWRLSPRNQFLTGLQCTPSSP